MPLPALGHEYLTAQRLRVRSGDQGAVFIHHTEKTDPQALAEITALLELSGCSDVQLELSPDQELTSLQARAESEAAATAAELIAKLENEGADLPAGDLASHDLAELASQAPVVRLVNLLLAEAVDAGASDVHLEASADRLQVRYRVDGTLMEVPSPPGRLRAAVVSRLKIMAELDIAERRMPQDGRIRLRHNEREVDVRVSTLPTLHGESVVLRLLETGKRRLGIGALGLERETQLQLERAIRRPHGVLLSTGPTGSGKTTTLYALLDRLRTGSEKIVTVEDPIEYELEGITQIPVHHGSGLGFGQALRSILRQDPDVLLVGEMRDAETAQICVQASLTGHLVLSTLHTNDAPGAVIRLLDLGVPDYLIADTVQVVLAQRLVRTICPDCCEERELPSAIRSAMAADSVAGDGRAWHGVGCDRCRGTGYRGRTGIYEFLRIDDPLRNRIRSGNAAGLRQHAIDRGMRTLRRDGWRHVSRGRTTPEEVLRVTAA